MDTQVDKLDEVILRHILFHPGCTYHQLSKVTCLKKTAIKSRIYKLAGMGFIKHPRGRHGTLVILDDSVYVDARGNVARKRLELEYVE